MNAREAWCFLKFFVLYIFDLVPASDQVLMYVHCLQEMVELCLLPEYKSEHINKLKSIIELHHSSYLTLFNDSLKPKHHFIVHYPMIIEETGPLKENWSMRYESKHRELVNYSNCITSRRNLPLSIAKKCCMKFAYDHILNITPSVDFTNIVTYDSNLEAKYYLSVISKDIIIGKKYNFASSIKYKGTQFKIGYYVFENRGKSFFEIIDLIEMIENQYFIIGRKIEIQFNIELRCYLIMSNVFPETESYFSIIDFQSKLFMPYNLIKLIDGRMCFKPTFD